MKPIKDTKFLKLRFGGGLHSRASEEDVDPRECTDGENFALDPDNEQFRPRASFDLIGTLPNAGNVLGGATLLKADGTISTLIQGDGKVYEWDGTTNFTHIGTVSDTAKLRGRLEQNWQLTNKVIITDIALVDPVKEWDGTTFQNVTFTDEEGYNFGTFKARYCYVSNERAVFANVESNGTQTPHLVVGSQRGDYTNITIVNRPSSAASAADPFYIVQPDNRYINSLVNGYGKTLISSAQGALYVLSGSDATDFSLDSLHNNTGIIGDEAASLANNDIVYGSQGRIKSLVGVQQYGDVQSSDISYWIADQIEDYNDWLVATNRRLERTYFHPVGESVIYVLHHALLGSGVSPWSKWTTGHSLSMNPTLMMSVLDPNDGLEYVIMGDSTGNVYRLEGSGTGDGGTNDVTAYRTSKIYSADGDAHFFSGEGYVRYRRQNAVTANISVIYSGDRYLSETVTVDMPAPTYSPVYGTTAFYGTQYYYGTSEGQLFRQPIAMAGASSDFQIKVSITDSNTWTINEVGFGVKEAN